ncbi:MAG: type I restriction enzyme S subunit [Oleispira sp.]|jgi:type I restriction enzyme S subunit
MSDLVPDGWKTGKFSELAQVQNGYAFKSNDFSEGETNAVVRMNNLKTGIVSLKNSKFVSDETVQHLDQFRLNNGDFLFGMSGSLDNYGWLAKINGSCYLNQRVGKLKPSVTADSRFTAYLFLSNQVRNEIRLMAAGAAQLNISGNQLESIKVSIPPLIEQQKIATTLSSVDEVIEKTQAQIDKLKDLKTGMMQELLSPSEGQAANIHITQGESKNGLLHTEFKDSPLGRIPVGWEVIKVVDLQSKEKYSCVGGPFGSDLTSKHYINEIGVPVIRGANLSLTSKRFTDSGFVYVSESKADSLARNMAYPGDFVFTQRGTMGQVGLIPDHAKFKRYVVSQSQMKLTIDESIVDKDFLYQYFLSDIFLRSLDLETIATGLPHINLGILKSFNIPLPSMQEQKEIRIILNSMDDKLTSLLGRQEKYKNLKKSLMQDLLTGKVRVKVDEA